LDKGWAIVTGASSGIGRAFALELARRGYSVLAVARRRERLEALAKEAALRGGPIEPLVADLQTEEGVASVMRRVEAIGEIELLVNNAGIAAGGDFLATGIGEAMSTVRLNIGAVVSLTHQILRGMFQRQTGAVINMASVLAFQPFPHFGVYAASKAFVLMFTEALAAEVRGTGVRVLALCPGAVRTKMGVFARNEGILGKLPSLSSEQVVKAGLQALDRGNVIKVVGGINKLLPFMNRLVPRRTMRWLMGVSARPPYIDARPHGVPSPSAGPTRSMPGPSSTKSKEGRSC
jgi:short-subunit dehydrogenase